MGRYFPIHIRPERAEGVLSALDFLFYFFFLSGLFLFLFLFTFNETVGLTHVTSHVTAASHMTFMANLSLNLFPD